MIVIAIAIIFIAVGCSQMQKPQALPNWIGLTEAFSDSEGYILVVGYGQNLEEGIAKEMAEAVARIQIADYVKKNFSNTNLDSIRISASPVRRYYDPKSGYYYVLLRTNRAYK